MNASRLGFHAQTVYKLKQPSFLQAAKQKLSFAVASLSLFAFVIGNMVGQHGWYSFWKTVLGKDDDVTIAFVGTVAPIDKIPNYAEWAKYGGSKQLHTFDEVPQNVLHDLPVYDQSELRAGSASSFAMQVYSTLWEGGYNSPSGSHAGVDIDAPRGTPVQSIANGVVERVTMGTTGFGHYVLIRHPNAPDAGSVGGKTTLRSTYAHMDTVLVREGQVVYKGQQIGTVGNTGLVFGATGYHLYFEVDRDSAPYHPYWPFTSGEATAAGLTYVQAVNSPRFQDRLDIHTLNPMAFVQQYKNYAGSTIIAQEASAGIQTTQTVDALSAGDRYRLMKADRLRSRIARATLARATVSSVVVAAPQTTAASDSTVSDIVVTSVSADVTPSFPMINGSNTDVDHLSIQHSGVLSRTWQKVKISALDSAGNLVRSPSFSERLYLRSDFGEAEIRPSELSPLDFVNGIATVNVLTRTQSKPVFIVTKGAFETISAPMVSTR